MMLGTNIHSSAVVHRIPPNSVGAELGVWKGDTAELFLKSGKVRHLYLVDAWGTEPYIASAGSGFVEGYVDRYAGLAGGRKPADFERYYEEVYVGVKRRFSDDSRVTIVRSTTQQFFADLGEGAQLGWVYIDASHERVDVLFDLAASWKVTRPHGHVFGDDYGNKPGVTEAVDQFCSERGLRSDNFYENQYEILGQA